MSEYELKQLRDMLDFLMTKIAYDRERILTHAQRNINDDWNVGYLSYCRQKVDNAIDQDKATTDQIPF